MAPFSTTTGSASRETVTPPPDAVHGATVAISPAPKRIARAAPLCTATGVGGRSMAWNETLDPSSSVNTPLATSSAVSHCFSSLTGCTAIAGQAVISSAISSSGGRRGRRPETYGTAPGDQERGPLGPAPGTRSSAQAVAG